MEKRYSKWVFCLFDILACVFGIAFELGTFYYIFSMLSFGYSEFDFVMMMSSAFITAFSVFLHTTIAVLFDVADILERKGQGIWKKRKHHLRKLLTRLQHTWKSLLKSVRSTQ